jgi:hypothetical protein
MVFENSCPRNSGPTTPVKRGKGRNPRPHSVESPYFSPSKERPPRPTGKGENFLIDERRLQSTDRSLDSPQNYASESDDPFTQTPASPSSVARLYRQLALCKPYLIQGVLSFISIDYLL